MYFFVLILILVLIIIFIFNRNFNESFENSEPMTLLIFVSDSCGHCVDYIKNYHDGIVSLAKSKNINVKKYVSNIDPEMFKKFNINFVPTAILMKGDKIYKNLGSNVNPESIKAAIS